MTERDITRGGGEAEFNAYFGLEPDSAAKIASDLHKMLERLVYGLPKYLDDTAQTDEENLIGEAHFALDVTAHRLAALSQDENCKHGGDEGPSSDRSALNPLPEGNRATVVVPDSNISELVERLEAVRVEHNRLAAWNSSKDRPKRVAFHHDAALAIRDAAATLKALAAMDGSRPAQEPVVPTEPVSTPVVVSARKWPTKGSRMRFLGKNGYEFERVEAMKLLNVGGVYEVTDCDVGDWEHSVALKGYEGKWFNGVMFDLLDPTQPEDGSEVVL